MKAQQAKDEAELAEKEEEEAQRAKAECKIQKKLQKADIVIYLETDEPQTDADQLLEQRKDLRKKLRAQKKEVQKEKLKELEEAEQKLQQDYADAVNALIEKENRPDFISRIGAAIGLHQSETDGPQPEADTRQMQDLRKKLTAKIKEVQTLKENEYYVAEEKLEQAYVAAENALFGNAHRPPPSQSPSSDDSVASNASDVSPGVKQKCHNDEGSVNPKDKVGRKDPPNVPPSLYCFLEPGIKNLPMTKEEANTLLQKYIAEYGTVVPPNQRDPPLKNAVYIMKLQKGDIFYNKNTEGMEYESNTRGRTNPDMKAPILYHQFSLKLGPRQKGIKQRDANRLKDIFTFQSGVNLQMIHYRGNWPLEGAPDTDPDLPPSPPDDRHSTVADVSDNDIPDTIVNLQEHTSDPEDAQMEYSDMYAKPRFHSDSKLDFFEAEDIINKYSLEGGKYYNSCDQSIVNPRAGEVYIFDLHGWGDTWKKQILRDTYSWASAYHKDSEDKQTTLTRFFVCDVDPSTSDQAKGSKTSKSKFTRFVYHNSEKRIAVVQYVGDETKVTRIGHGNSQQTDRPFFATRDTVIWDIKKYGLSAKPSAIYRDNRKHTLPGMLSETGNARNAKQVSNIQQKMRNEIQLSTNQLENIVAVSKYLPGYVREVRYHSLTDDATDQISVTLVCPQMADEFRSMLRMMPLGQPVVFGLDTTYKMGRFFVTPLNARNPCLERRVAGTNQTNKQANMNIGIHIHEERHLDLHQHFLQNVFKAIDFELPPDARYRLSRRHIDCLSDDEFSDVQMLFAHTGETKCPAEVERIIRHLPCWIHLKDNVKRKLKDLKLDEKDIKLASAQFLELLKSDSEVEYQERKEKMFGNSSTSPWNSEAASAYFEMYLDSKCVNNACTFRLREAQVPNPEFGITNNASESYNAFLKRNSDSNEQPIGECMLNLYYCMRVQAAELAAAHYGMGPYQLTADYKQFEEHPTKAPSTTYQSVNDMRKYLHSVLADQSKATPPPGGVHPDTPILERPTVEKIAELLVNQGHISFSTDEVGMILVKSLDGTKIFRVSIPLSECSCGLKNCSHLRAAMKQTGFAEDFQTPPKPRQRPVLKPKPRRAKGVKSGTKTPRKKDTVRTTRKRKANVDDFLPMLSTTRTGKNVI